jgi:membrane protease YdiL (CAAX protease family)
MLFPVTPARSALTLFLYLALIFVLTALFAPWAYLGLHGLLPYPFHRYVNRVLMVAAVGGLFLFWRGLGIKSAREIGLGGWRAGKWDLAVGFMLGIGSSALFLGAAFVAGGRVLHGSLPVGWLLGVLAGAAVLSVIEEILFRGILQTVLVRVLGPAGGIVLGSLLFAVFHYIKVPPGYAPDPVTAASGWTAVGLAFAPFGGTGWLEPRFGLLAGVGLVLGLAAWRTGKLWLPIGLHAGWIVLGLKIGGKVTEGVPGHWAAADFTANPLSFLILALVALAVWMWPRSSTI